MQYTVQIGTFDVRVDQKINEILAANPSWYLTALYPMPVHRIGGNDQHVLLVFEGRAATANKPYVSPFTNVD